MNFFESFVLKKTVIFKMETERDQHFFREQFIPISKEFIYFENSGRGFIECN